MESIESIMPDSLKELHIWELFQEQKLLHEWSKVVGNTISHNVKILSIKVPIVYVGVFNSAWMQQVNMQKRQIIQKINQFYGKELITDLKYKMYGQQPGVQENINTDVDEEFGQNVNIKIDLTKISISQEELITIENNLKSISDKDLAEKMKIIMVDQIRRQKYMASKNIHFCTDCGKPLASTEKICLTCQYKRERNLIAYTIKLIKKYPQVNFEEFIKLADDRIKKIIPYLTVSDFLKAKKEAIYYYLDNIYKGSIKAEDLFQVVMLITSKPKEELTLDYVINMTNRYRPKWILEELMAKYNWPVAEKLLKEKEDKR